MDKDKSFDIVMPGYFFCDLIFHGLPGLPQMGEEIFSKSLDITVGGVFNSAIGMRRLGLQIGIISNLGNDIFSEFIRNQLRVDDISDLLIRNHQKPMPTITAALSFPDDRAFVTYMSTNDTNTFPFDVLSMYSFKHLHLPGLKEAFDSKSIIHEAKKKGMTISLDCQWHPNLMDDPNVWLLLESVDIFMPNEKEAIYLTKANSIDDALNILGQRVQSVVIKLGKHGAIGLDSNGVIAIPPLNVQIVDTTGAGDSFNAGFLFGYLKELSFRESIIYGNICGGLSVTAPGGGTATPTFDQLQKRLGEFL